MPARALARNWSRCSTPNRCCSSTTTMPRLWKFHRVLQQRVGADDDAGLTAGDLVADLLLLRGRHRAGEQRHSGRVVGPAQLARHRQRRRARRGSTADVVQQGLPSAPAARTGSPRRPSAASPAPRRSSCRNRPRPAAGGSSGGSPPARRTARRAPRAVPPSARTATAPTIPPPGRRAARGACGPDSDSSPCRRATSAHCRPTASSKVNRSRARRRSCSFSEMMNGAQRLVLGDQAEPGAQFRRQRVVHRIEYFEHLPDAVAKMSQLCSLVLAG